MLESPAYYLSQQMYDEAREILTKIGKTNKVLEGEEKFTAPFVTEMKSSFTPVELGKLRAEEEKEAG